MPFELEDCLIYWDLLVLVVMLEKLLLEKLPVMKYEVMTVSVVEKTLRVAV
jgi:hypothetical protein